MKQVIGVFRTRSAAKAAIQEMQKQGFANNRISLLSKENAAPETDRRETTDPVLGGTHPVAGAENRHDDSIADGATTGGVIGGLAGLAIGAGALVIPGLGPLVAAGPIAGLISGAATGGIAGGLIDWGVPAEHAEHYERSVKQGHILVAVEAEDSEVERAAQLLRSQGAYDVETHAARETRE